MRTTNLVSLLVGVSLSVLAPLSASGAIVTQTFDLTESYVAGQTLDGLAARATFTLDTSSPSSLTITLKNISTGVPLGTDSASQLLTALSFDLGGMGGLAGDPSITGGSAVIGLGGASVNLPNPLSAGADISAEWGYGNNGTGLVLPNRITAMRGGNSSGFLGNNLQGPAGGVLTNPPLVAIGGQSGFSDSVVVTVTLDKPLTDLSFLDNGVRAEFGSDYRFAGGSYGGPPIPEPATLSVMVLGSLVALLRRRRHA